MKNKKTITIGSNILSKICNHCETEKLITEFNKAKNGLYGVGATCKLCRRKQMREYRKNNYEKLTNYVKAYRITHPDYWKEYYIKSKLKYLKGE